MAKSSTNKFYGTSRTKDTGHKTRREIVKEFVEEWTNKGKDTGYGFIKEDANRQSFINDFLRRVCGIAQPTKYIEYEKDVMVKGSSHPKQIDGYIPSTKVMWEMKGSNKDLTQKIEQSGDIKLTPFEQAWRYSEYLPQSEKPRWIIISNFDELDIHDMDHPLDEPTVINLKDLTTKYKVFDFMIDATAQQIIDEKKLSIDAGVLVGKIYNELAHAYSLHADLDDPGIQKSLNMLIVRLVFLLYADDTGILGEEDMFQHLLENQEPDNIRPTLKTLFNTLNTPENERDAFLADKYKAFKYVNGGMFADETAEIPQFTDELKDLIVNEAGKGFNWSNISPTIFGAVFESTLNPVIRRKGGMHYTSIENIHKVIDTLFLNDLQNEFKKIKDIPNTRDRVQKAYDFQDKLAKLKFLDPACGSGNFLTETYLELRHLENECLRIIVGNNSTLNLDSDIKVKIKIQNFYGIEINDFAVSVARTAMWIAESQMWDQSQNIIYSREDFLPLDSNDSIYEGNALRIDWSDIVKPYELNYIMGNPPFVGYKYLSDAQKSDLIDLIGKTRAIDYVVGWYYKALDFMEGTTIKSSLVSTNSITQGSAIQNVWKPLYKKHKTLEIIYAYKTFIWENATKNSAAVHCVIIGFSLKDVSNKIIYDGENKQKCHQINPYLVDGSFIPITRIGKPRQNVGKMTKGAQLIDGGNFRISDKEKDEIIKQSPEMRKNIYEYLNSHMFLHNHVSDKPSYVLYLKDCDPSIIRKSKIVMDKIKEVQEFREGADAPTTNELADRPSEYFQSQTPKNNNIIVPVVSSGNRKYIPMDFMPPKHVYTNALFYLDNANLIQFGILQSSVHMCWANLIVGRLKSDFRYSNSIVYNNFPWPNLDDNDKKKIEETAQGILDARKKYPNSSLSDLYDSLSMPSELRKAHKKNDNVVLQAYGLSTDATDQEIMQRLFSMYEKLAK